MALDLGEPFTEEEAKEALSNLAKYVGSEIKEKPKLNFKYFISWWSNLDKESRSFKLIASQILKGDKPFNVDKVMMHPEGDKFTLDYRLNFFYAEGKQLKKISPWHDIPLYVRGYGTEAEELYFICEIPKYTRAKFEIATRMPMNPMKQDIKNGRTRYYHHQSLFNYGLFPQTWEDPNHHIKFPSGKTYPGDNDPIDVLELGYKQLKTGDIVKVKVLGILALIDDGETDWKVLTINVDDPMADKVNDVEDVQREFPGVIDAILFYFKNYKVLSGNEPNTFEFNDQAQNRAKALEIIQETHGFWKDLRKEENVPVFTPVTT
eukprot:CAMPEP_0117430066 /NCGR_PEP_ID=MMETSP0758-20121206/9590_1 /TAXON_ID=63605 /ORGANISM="Percolomonas cosmopolitus, Strain AE-1 (ATCC 50343)" /LENGTH=319 /DNA_ID=CAMNT_0005217683 /DNA_START=175 /DNA_END=1130 /DNA_ORIENTATION=+